MSDTLTHGKVGIFHYTLTNDEGATLDSSRGGQPMAYLHGFQNIVPGLESELEGKGAGDTFIAHVAPKDGYGEKEGPGPQAVHRSNFPKDFEPQIGRPIRAEGGDGQVVTLWITGVKGAQVYLDVNHPLAGQNLHFDIEVVGVRDATDNEKQHGHAHGIDGHAHHH
tara:strand:+ start:172 stop:669 length:498 start_codon:yes stop_codon:yes gene_type:complete